MTDAEDKKIDGWCAWHPVEGYYPATEDGGIFVADDQDNLSLNNDSPKSRRMRKEGWDIIPVRIIPASEKLAHELVTELRKIYDDAMPKTYIYADLPGHIAKANQAVWRRIAELYPQGEK